MKAREQRFIGHGNSAVGDNQHKTKCWRLQCRSCNNFAIVTLAHPLPPSIVVKKFLQKGWFVGQAAEEDICDECRTSPTGVAGIAAAKTPPVDPQIQEESTRVRQLRNELRQLQQTYQRDVAAVRQANDELRQALEEDSGVCIKLRMERDKLLGQQQNVFAAFRNLHELLLQGAIEVALQKIEQSFPRWQWDRRLPKRKGSAMPKQRTPTENENEYQKWLSNQGTKV